MSDGELLLSNILNDPADDTARLVYADWLDENGQGERAECVRVQCELSHNNQLNLAGIWVDGRRWNSQVLRMRDLFFGGAAEWFWLPYFGRPSYSVDRVLEWRGGDGCPVANEPIAFGLTERGFVSEIRLTCEAFLTHAKAIFRSHPVTEVKLTCRTPHTGVFHRDNDPTWHLQDKRYWLWEVNRGGWIARCQIPWKILRHMRNEVGVLGHHQYLSEESAWKALSDGCVAYGREVAGLPPLPVHEEVKS